MHDHSDGCFLIVLSVGGAFLLTLFTFFTLLGARGGLPAGLLSACGVAWMFVIGVILAEAIRDQRRPRR